MMIEYRKLDWWYWLVLVVLLALGLAGGGPALSAFVAVSAAQLVHFVIRSRSVTAFPVQTRSAYLLLALVGLWPPLGFVHWSQLAGTLARVAFGYCVLARTMSLLSWNRREPLTARLVWSTFASPPVRGSILAARP